APRYGSVAPVLWRAAVDGGGAPGGGMPGSGGGASEAGLPRAFGDSTRVDWWSWVPTASGTCAGGSSGSRSSDWVTSRAASPGRVGGSGKSLDRGSRVAMHSRTLPEVAQRGVDDPPDLLDRLDLEPRAQRLDGFRAAHVAESVRDGGTQIAARVGEHRAQHADVARQAGVRGSERLDGGARSQDVLGRA